MAKGKKSEGEKTMKKEDDHNYNAGSFLNIVLKVDLHCQGCTARIYKYILNFPGVLKVEFEGESKVKVMAEKNVDAVKLRDKLHKKMLKSFELVSPKPPKNEEHKRKQNEEKPKEVPITTVMLKVQYHCHGCLEKIHKAFKSYKGVHELKFDREKETVKVTGRIDVKKMMDEISKKLHRPIVIVPEKVDKKHKQANNNNQGEVMNNKDNVKDEHWVYGPGYVGLCDGSGRVLDQIFDTSYLSDDNPNACFIM